MDKTIIIPHGKDDVRESIGKIFDAVISGQEIKKETVSDYVMSEVFSVLEKAVTACQRKQWLLCHSLPFGILLRLSEEQSDCDKIMQSYYKNDDYANFINLFETYKDNIHLSQHKTTLKKTYDLFLVGEYSHILVYSLVAIFDSVLSNVSKNDAHYFSERLNSLNKIASVKIFEPQTLITFAFKCTFNAMERFNDNSYKFENGIEPPELNRHWIMHGRSKKQFNEIDCLKLFNFIFSTLYISEL